MSSANLDAYDLAGVDVGGTIAEDVMNKLYDISPVDRPFCDSIGSGTSGNDMVEWVREALEAASKDNATIGNGRTSPELSSAGRQGRSCI